MQTQHYTHDSLPLTRVGTIWTLPVLAENEQGFCEPSELCLERVDGRWSDPMSGLAYKEVHEITMGWGPRSGECIRLSLEGSRRSFLVRADLLEKVASWASAS